MKPVLDLPPGCNPYWRMTLREPLKLLWGWFVSFLQSHAPVFCASCSRLMFRKDAQFEQSQTGAILPLCASCHDEIFKLFG